MNTFKRLILVLLFFSITTNIDAQRSEAKSKTLHHVLLIQWSQGHDEQVKSEVIQLFEGLPKKVEGLVSFSIKKVEKSSGDFHNALVFKFSSQEGLATYDKHPDHEKVKKLAPVIISNFAEYDYWEL
ncbi:MAG: Dabb family protein [Roseivirga sp.]|nr:Dabb family protein [Roseivirga sp.]